jgi:hypothetical protein
MERQKRIEEINLLREEIAMLIQRLEQCKKKLSMYQEDTLNTCNKENILIRALRFFTTEPDWFGNKYKSAFKID